MVNLVTLDSRAHRDLRVSRHISPQYAQVDAVSVIPLEFQRLVAHYPIFYIKSAESGRFEPVVLLGFRKKEKPRREEKQTLERCCASAPS